MTARRPRRHRPVSQPLEEPALGRILGDTDHTCKLLACQLDVLTGETKAVHLRLIQHLAALGDLRLQAAWQLHLVEQGAGVLLADRTDFRIVLQRVELLVQFLNERLGRSLLAEGADRTDGLVEQLLVAAPVGGEVGGQVGAVDRVRLGQHVLHHGLPLDVVEKGDGLRVEQVGNGGHLGFDPVHRCLMEGNALFDEYLSILHLLHLAAGLCLVTFQHRERLLHLGEQLGRQRHVGERTRVGDELVHPLAHVHPALGALVDGALGFLAQHRLDAGDAVEKTASERLEAVALVVEGGRGAAVDPSVHHVVPRGDHGDTLAAGQHTLLRPAQPLGRVLSDDRTGLRAGGFPEQLLAGGWTAGSQPFHLFRRVESHRGMLLGQSDQIDEQVDHHRVAGGQALAVPRRVLKPAATPVKLLQHRLHPLVHHPIFGDVVVLVAEILQDAGNRRLDGSQQLLVLGRRLDIQFDLLTLGGVDAAGHELLQLRLQPAFLDVVGRLLLGQLGVLVGGRGRLDLQRVVEGIRVLFLHRILAHLLVGEQDLVEGGVGQVAGLEQVVSE